MALVVGRSPVQARGSWSSPGLVGRYLGGRSPPTTRAGPPPQAEQLDFRRRQVLPSRHLAGRRPVDGLLGGRNDQMAHHLVPTLPRPHLRPAQPPIRAFCEDHDLVSAEASLVGSYAQALRHLPTIGAPLRPAVAAAD